MRLCGDYVGEYIWNVLISIDQFINTLLGGYPDETISSRMGKRVVKGDSRLCKFICILLNKLDKNHCVNSIEKDEGESM